MYRQVLPPLLLFAGIVFALPGLAQDKCSDVLVDGPFAYQNYKDDSYFNQIVWSRFLRTTYESSKTDRDAGFGVPIGEIVLGGNYTQAQYDAKKKEIQKEYFKEINASREVSVALMSGDEEVLDAWTNCMRTRGGGISVRFEPLTPIDVFMHVEYYNVGIVNEVKLLKDVVLSSDVTVTAGADCLRKKKKYVNGKPCVAQLRLKSPLNYLPVVVDADNSVATAWLPRRLELLRVTEPYTFSPADRLYDRAHKTRRQHRRDINLSSQQMAQGWRFDPSTARTGLQVIYAYSSSIACHKEWSTATAASFSYGYEIWAKDRIRKDGVIVCAMNPYIQMRRDIWVPQEANADISELASDMRSAGVEGNHSVLAQAVSESLKKVNSLKKIDGPMPPPNADGSEFEALLKRASLLDAP